MFKSVFAFLLILLLILVPHATQAQTTWISGVTTSSTNTSVTIAWNTAVPATTGVQYGLTTSYGSHIPTDYSLVTQHSATVSGLTPGTLYHMRLQAKDAEPVQLNSTDYAVTTQTAAVSVTVSPTSGTVASGGSQQFTTQVKNATKTAVTWTASAGSITNAGLFTAPVVVTDQQVTITATSVADPSKSAKAVFTVKAPVQHSVSLNWQASPSKNIAFYSAYRSSTHGGPYGLMASAITGLAYSDSSVQSGATYYYVVTATDDSGEESADSHEVAATVPSP